MWAKNHFWLVADATMGAAERDIDYSDSAEEEDKRNYEKYSCKVVIQGEKSEVIPIA